MNTFVDDANNEIEINEDGLYSLLVTQASKYAASMLGVGSESIKTLYC
jgi:hypothetical protein